MLVYLSIQNFKVTEIGYILLNFCLQATSAVHVQKSLSVDLKLKIP